MFEDNVIYIKACEFAKRIVNLYKYLTDVKREYVMSKQLLRSGTSIGANIAEALCGISKRDFHAKMNISFKEAVESAYWLKLLRDTDFLNDQQYQSLRFDCEEIIKILSSITKSTSEALNNTKA